MYGTLQTSDVCYTTHEAAQNAIKNQVNPSQWGVLPCFGMRRTCELAVKKFGVESRKRMAVEEAAELIDALMKEYRGRATKGDVITEIADVQIMMEQLSIIYGSDKVAREREHKLERLMARIQNG